MNMLSCARRRNFEDAFLGLERLRAGMLMLVLSFALGLPAAENDPNPSPKDLTELPIEALMNLEVPKVYAASKIEQKSTEAPASTTIVTSDEIKKFGYRTLGRNQPGRCQ
jgi:outer membrane receptor for ferrienterochelin and colicins